MIDYNRDEYPNYNIIGYNKILYYNMNIAKVNKIIDINTLFLSIIIFLSHSKTFDYNL